MSNRKLTNVLDQVRRVAAGGEGGISDAHLLERFASSRDEAAFELLVWRYQRLVFNVCRRVLQHAQEAEDAFQATFLVLARKAGSISRREALPGWLYRVAYRVAVTARAGRARRNAREQPMSAAAERGAPGAGTVEQRDLRAVLDEEMSRLPERVRLALVLCYLEGKTIEEAAQQLGCPCGTIASRLVRGRERLRALLGRRGLALTAIALAEALSQAGLSAAAPEGLLRAAVRGGLCGVGKIVAGAEVSSKVTTLTKEVLRAMFFRKLMTGAVLLIAFSGVLLFGGSMVVSGGAQAPAEPMRRVAEGPRKPPPLVRKDTGPRLAEAPRQVTVSRPVARDFTPFEDYTGRLEGASIVEVRAGGRGEVRKVFVKSGAEVKKGARLFEIDPKDLKEAVATAQAARIKAQARHERAELAFVTIRKAFVSGITTQKDMDKATEDRGAAMVAFEEAERAVESARRAWMSASSILAPVDGRVGQVPTVGQTIGEGTRWGGALTKITSLHAIGLRFEMDERSLLRYRRLVAAGEVKEVGGALHMGVVDEEGYPRQGLLDHFNSEVNPKTSTIGVFGIFSNRDKVLLPGMFARVRMPFGRQRRSLQVPEAAIVSDKGKRYLMVVNDSNVLERREVKVGARAGKMRVIETGLRAGEWVVTVGAKDLRPGDKVEPRWLGVPRGKAPGKD